MLLTGSKGVTLILGIAVMLVSHGGGLMAQSPTPAQQASDELAMPSAPEWLGTVTLPRAVMADGQRLAAGAYRVRLTTETAKPVVGQRAASERWVEFVQNNDVRGRALAPVVPSSAVPEVTTKAAVPPPGKGRVQTLRAGDDYVRVWFNYKGDQVLIYLPYAK